MTQSNRAQNNDIQFDLSTSFFPIVYLSIFKIIHYWIYFLYENDNEIELYYINFKNVKIQVQNSMTLFSSPVKYLLYLYGPP